LGERVRVRGKPYKNSMHALTLALSQGERGQKNANLWRGGIYISHFSYLNL